MDLPWTAEALAAAVSSGSPAAERKLSFAERPPTPLSLGGAAAGLRAHSGSRASAVHGWQLFADLALQASGEPDELAENCMHLAS